MRKIFAFLLSLAMLAACEEWDPVLTGRYPDPPEREPLMATVNTTIAGLKKLYTDAGKAVAIQNHLVIGGQVTFNLIFTNTHLTKTISHYALSCSNVFCGCLTLFS